MHWSSLLVRILTIAFSAAYPTETTTSSNGSNGFGTVCVVSENERIARKAGTGHLFRENTFVIKVKEWWKHWSPNHQVCNQGWDGNMEKFNNNYQKPTLEQTLLPSDILRIIFRFLKPEDLRIAAQVCKDWNREADDVERLRSVSEIVVLGKPCSKNRCERKKLQRYNEHVDSGTNRKHPIRGAIVISRILLEDEPIDSAEERAENVCHFLKSLPEANNMPVCVVVDDYFTTKEDTKIRSNGSVAVILFGGKAVQATVASFKTMWEWNEDFFKAALEHWKEGECKCLSNATQTIAFYGNTERYSCTIPSTCFRSVFGDDIPCANLGNQGRVFVLRKAQNGNLRGIGGEWTRTIGYLIVGFE